MPDRPQDQSGKVQFLKTVKAFAELDAEVLADIVSRLKVAEFQPSGVIIREGGPGVSMFIVNSGLAEMRRRDPATGIEVAVGQLADGDIFGEDSILTGRPRSATVIAVQPCKLSSLTRANFVELLRMHPEIALGLARMASERGESAMKQIGIAYVNLSKQTVDRSVLQLLPLSTMRMHMVVPIALSETSLSLAMVNPSNLVAFDDVRRVVQGRSINPLVCTEQDFRAFMATAYPRAMGIDATDEGSAVISTSDTSRKGKKANQSEETGASPRTFGRDSVELENVNDDFTTPMDLTTAADDAPVVRLVNDIFASAIKKGASDIHFDPQDQGLLLRFRIDGVLQAESVLPKKIQVAVASRIKIMASLDISERRLPQDGRIKIKIDGRTVDLRVSTAPAKFGEKIVLTILDTGPMAAIPLDRLISDVPTLEKVRGLINQPYGIIYVIGPTGSGKTLTVYSALGELDSKGLSISTAEDSIDVNLPTITQMQTRREIGLDFARLLKVGMRQDVDVMFIGEIRDMETAGLAVEAAISGRLLFTTLYANDAPSSFARLEEMGIAPFLIANSTIGVIAQRLARRICQDCKTQIEVDEATLDHLGFTKENAPPFFKGKGCSKCNNTGKKGRVGVYEVLVVNEEIKRAVARGASADEIRSVAVQNGMKTLKDYALTLAAKGLLSLEEVLTKT